MRSVSPEVDRARETLRDYLNRIVGEGELSRLDEALTHPSYANESGVKDNQRLEFLGDAVLGLCVSELLAKRYPDADEGDLTRMRSALVNADALARWARGTNLGDCLALGRGARSGTERTQTNVLADAVEALVAAIYENRGISGARKFVDELVREPLISADALRMRDPKSDLQERVQSQKFSSPVYHLVRTLGPKHDQEFEVEVVIGLEVMGRGQGRSKRLAEREAASDALERLDAAKSEEND